MFNENFRNRLQRFSGSTPGVKAIIGQMEPEEYRDFRRQINLRDRAFAELLDRPGNSSNERGLMTILQFDNLADAKNLAPRFGISLTPVPSQPNLAIAEPIGHAQSNRRRLKKGTPADLAEAAMGRLWSDDAREPRYRSEPRRSAASPEARKEWNDTNFDNLMRDLLEDHEGVKYETYLDTEGNLTGGIGHLLTDEPGWELGDTISSDQVEAWYQEDLKSHAKGAMDLEKWDEFSPYLQGLLVSFVFNNGPNVFGLSGDPVWPKMTQALNEGRWLSAAQEVQDDWDWVQASRRDQLVDALLDPNNFINQQDSEGPLRKSQSPEALGRTREMR